jgi:hypothetical protein
LTVVVGIFANNKRPIVNITGSHGTNIHF